MVGSQKVKYILLCCIAMLSFNVLFSQTDNFKHHENLVSGCERDGDSILFPNHIFIEENLDSLDMYVQVSPHNMKMKDYVGISFFVDGENHADAIVFKPNATSLSILIQYTINGEIIPRKTVYMGAFSKKASMHIKRVDNNIVFYYPYDREIDRIGLGYLIGENYLYENIAPIVMYAVHSEKHKPFTVDFNF